MENYDFSGWATRNNVLCSDGRIICQDAFKHQDGMKIPLVWNHRHNESEDVLGHAILQNRDEGVYAYCKFNDTESGKNAKLVVEHGDVNMLSIYANQLKQQGPNVKHGMIREVSLVLASANPKAYIESVIKHGDEFTLVDDSDECRIQSGYVIELYHSDEEDEKENVNKDEKKEDEKMAEKDKTIQDVIDSMTDEQREVMYAVVGMALEDEENKDEDEGDDKGMKHNVFDQDERKKDVILSHSDQVEILNMAKSTSVGSLRDAINIFAENNDVLMHGIVDEEGNDAIDQLFPEYKDVKPGAPEFIQRDQSWVAAVMNGTRKSPISRIRTRQADITGTDLRALGYKKGEQKVNGGNIKLLKRTTDPQTVYRKDGMHRDDIIDITDFDVVAWQYQVMLQNLKEEIATAILIGDGRDDVDEYKISEDHIRSIWNDDELYTIHADVDIEAAKKELQGTNTSANFGDNYVYAEAIITAALYSREQYKGSGNVDFYCTPHLLNVMLLARDLNGRRIYDSKTDLAAALNVKAIHTVEQFEGKTRTDAKGNAKKLLGIFVNLDDYQVGSTKGGEITKFNQFDIDFNQEKYLIETRLSGALIRVKSAIVLEEPTTAVAG